MKNLNIILVSNGICNYVWSYTTLCARVCVLIAKSDSHPHSSMCLLISHHLLHNPGGQASWRTCGAATASAKCSLPPCVAAGPACSPFISAADEKSADFGPYCCRPIMCSPLFAHNRAQFTFNAHRALRVSIHVAQRILIKAAAAHTKNTHKPHLATRHKTELPIYVNRNVFIVRSEQYKFEPLWVIKLFY